MYVLTSATDSFNIHTSLVWLDPSLFLRMHVNSNYNGRIAITMYTHARNSHVQRQKGLAMLEYIHT